MIIAFTVGLKKTNGAVPATRTKTLGSTRYAAIVRASQLEPTRIVRMDSSLWKRGAATDPANESAPHTASSPPIAAECSPCRRAATISVNSSAPKAKFVPTNSRSEEHTSELQSRQYLVCRLLLEKKT